MGIFEEREGVEFICLFIPGIISSRIHLKYFSNKSTEEKVSLYLIYTFIINMVTFTFINFYCEDAYTVFNNDLFSFNFIMKFMAFSFVISVVLPLVYYFVTKNVKVKIDVSRRKK